MNEPVIIMSAGLAVLSIASGMLGLGVAFAAVPFLSFFLHDLVHEVQPLSLFLNGITALFSLFGFARSGLVTWRPAILLAIVTTVTASFGAWLAQHVDARFLWAFYFVAVTYLAWRMFLPDKPGSTAVAEPNLKLALILAAPISVVAGILGVGPGFLLMPILNMATVVQAQKLEKTYRAGDVDVPAVRGVDFAIDTVPRGPKGMWPCATRPPAS